MELKTVEMPEYRAYGEVRAARITQITRSEINQSDGTAWLAFGELCVDGAFAGELVSESFIDACDASVGDMFVRDEDDDDSVWDTAIFHARFAKTVKS